jgi:hypothetical protein
MLDFPELLTPKKTVRGAKSIDRVSCQALKFWILNRRSMPRRLFSGPTYRGHVVGVRSLCDPGPTRWPGLLVDRPEQHARPQRHPLVEVSRTGSRQSR